MNATKYKFIKNTQRPIVYMHGLVGGLGQIWITDIDVYLHFLSTYSTVAMHFYYFVILLKYVTI